MAYSILGPVPRERNHSKLCRKWSAKGLRSDGNASNRTVPFQKMERLKSDTKRGTIRNRSVPFPSEQANGKHIHGTIAFPPDHKTKLVLNLPFPSEQPICPFQKLEMERNDCVPV